MRTLTHREIIPAADLAEGTCLEIGPQEHSKVTIAAYTTSANIRMKIYYLFDDNGTDTAVEMETYDIPQNDITIINFNFKLSKLRITRQDTGTDATAGILKIDATTSK